MVLFFFYQAEDGIRDLVRSRGLGDVYKRQLFRLFLRVRADTQPPQGLFPRSAAFATHADDAARERIFAPIFALVGLFLSRLRWLQEGRVHVYVLYIALTLLALLLFAL